MQEVVTTTVEEVTVYIDRARITRRGTVDVEAGTHRLEVTDLPLALDPESLRVKACGSAMAVIRGIDTGRAFFQKSPPGRARELGDEIRELEDRDRGLADTAQSLTGQVKHIDGLWENTRTFAIGLARGKTSTENHSHIIDTLMQKRMDTQARLRENDFQRRELAEQINKLKQQLKQVEVLKPTQRYTVSVEIEVTVAGGLDLQLIYTLPGASWKPVYDLRLSESAGTGDPDLRIDYLGQVTQSTGEDWDGVRLFLSTAPPGQGGRIPELEPWYIGPRAVPRPQFHAAALGGAPPMAGAAPPAPRETEIASEELLEEFEGEEAADEIREAGHAMADVRQGGTSVTYAISGLTHIPGDRSPHKTVISSTRLPYTIDYVTAPRIEPGAHRRIRAKNTSELMFLPGAAQVFDADDYIGSARLKPTAPGEMLEFYAGTDDRIRVERELTGRETDRKKLADKRRIRYTYTIKLENHTGTDQPITLRDQVPLSRHENIKVKLEDTDPRPTKVDGLNRIKWKLTLRDGEHKQVTYTYNVEYPRHLTIPGLP